MTDASLDLGSVHWENGMTLTDEHFVRQERYFDSSVLWLLRYTTAAFGLLGSGPRLDEGMSRPELYDPRVSVTENGRNYAIAVSACRGITLGGAMVDLGEEGAEMSIDRDQVREMETLYVLARPHDKAVYQTDYTGYDGQGHTERRQKYDLTLDPTQEDIPWCIAVARLRKSAATLMVDQDYIPPCAFLSGHSSLILYAEKVTGRLDQLVARFSELHRAMRECLVIAQRAGIMAELGLDEITFVGRMVVALRECLYEASESVQAPRRFLGQFRRLLHLADVYVNLSTRVRDHFKEVLSKLQKDYLQPLDNRVDRLLSTRESRINANLGEELQLIEDALKELEHVEEGMEAKYLDFRSNKYITSQDHFFDGDIVYRLVKSMAIQQGSRSEINAHLDLRGKELSGERVKYRIILAGDPNVSSFYAEVPIAVSINDGGQRPIELKCTQSRGSSGVPQFNFDFDFRPPDGQKINGLTVNYPAGFTFETLMLFEEIRMGSALPEEIPQPIAPQPAAQPTRTVFSGRTNQTIIQRPAPRTDPISRLREQRAATPQQPERSPFPPPPKRRMID